MSQQLKGGTMTKDAVLHVRLDPEKKACAEAIYASLGTSLSEATRMFINQSIQASGFPFVPHSSVGKGQLKAQGLLRSYAHTELREKEREAWIRSLSNKYESLNR